MPFRLMNVDRRLAGVLPDGALFAVGGRVRDELRGSADAVVQQKDLDYVVVGVGLEELRDRLGALGRADLVGASFAVLKLTLDKEVVDIALPRRERSTGSGHRDFAVESGEDVPLEDDLGRRDFRMNAIARALPSGDLVDPWHGEDDIRARRIDILNDRTFVEDPLRMLRAAQFAARFGYRMTERTEAAMHASAPLVSSISAERMCEELTKLLCLAPIPSAGLEALRRTGVLVHLWPELLEGVDMQQNEWHAYDVYRHNLESCDAAPSGDLIGRLAALLHDVGKARTKDGPHFYSHETVGAAMAADMLERLRFPGEVVRTVEHLVRQHMYTADPDLSDAAIRRFIRRIGPEHLERQFALRAADIAGSGLPKRDDSNEQFQDRVWAEVARKPAFARTDLAIDGKDVVEALVRRGLAAPGFRGDSRVGEALAALFEQVTERPESNERDTLLHLLEQYLDARFCAA